MTVYTLSHGTDLDISLNGSTDHNVGDASNAKWYLTNLEGWDGTPPVRNGMMSKSLVSGGAYLPQFYEPRPVTLTIQCLAGNGINAEVAKAVFRNLHAYALNSDIKFQQIEVFDGDTTAIFQYGRAGGEMKIDPPNGTGAFQLTFPIIFSNPGKYQVIVGGGGGGAPGFSPAGGSPPSGYTWDDVANAGTAWSYPVVTLTGAGAVDIANITFGGRVKTSGSLPSGTVIDFLSRTIIGPDGTNYYNLIHSSTVWWALPPSSTSVVQMGEADMEIAFFDSYI